MIINFIINSYNLVIINEYKINNMNNKLNNFIWKFLYLI